MTDGAFFIGGYPHDEHEPRFDLAAEVAKANAAYFAIEIPASIRKGARPEDFRMIGGDDER